MGFRQRLFLILISIALSFACLFVTIRYMPQVFSTVTVSITTNKADIEKASQQKCEGFGLEPFERSVTYFASNEFLQCFVELEGGGKAAFDKMIQDNDFQPYMWHTRFFTPLKIEEAHFYFTPQGEFYGLRRALPETYAGTNCTENEALQKVQAFVNTENIDLAGYALVEQTFTTMPSKRIDRSFVYERKDRSLGDGKYRIRFVVAGNEVAVYERFIKIPEAFERRYAHMRSYNGLLATFANFLMFLLYILCAIGGSMLLFSRLSWLKWRQALSFGFVIAALCFLVELNGINLWWLGYQTLHSPQYFLLQNGLIKIWSFIFNFCFFSTVIACAEGLSRMAFCHHPYLFSSWAPGIANSDSIFFRTILGYVFACFATALVIATYFFTTQYYGWWTPSEVLFNPNILAVYIPALNPIAISLQAGVVEECLFRAVPLACAALLGRYLKQEKLFLCIALFVQAAVFGGAHALYPTQPFYGRLLELMVPSLIWGLLYIRYGLIPGIIAHVMYDLFWFSMPLFISKAEGIWIQQLLVLCAGFIPLIVILYRFLKQGVWQISIETALNKELQVADTIHAKND
ncbi:CPBP family intramembrane metalloprotease [bacterium]|nr:MAG: CPBP family intramembrane metalloprotease [bacterium]